MNSILDTSVGGCDGSLGSIRSVTPLLDTIRRTIEERNLLTARSRIKYASAFRKASSNGNAALSSLSQPTKLNIQRQIRKMKDQIIKELNTSEKNYLKQINWIVNEFKLTLEIHSALTRKDMDLLFGNIELIKTLNGELYKALGTDCASVSEAFQQFAPMLKIYSAYARNYSQANETLQIVLGTNSTAASIIKEKEEKVKTKLSSLLIIPIQRIPRYKLFLEQLVALYKKDDIEILPAIQASLRSIDEVGQHMNEMVRSLENTKKILKIQNYFGKKAKKYELVQPGRTLIKEGIVYKPKHSRRYMVLFNDVFYFCKMKRGKNIRLHSPVIVPLRKCIVNLCENQIIIHAQESISISFGLDEEEELGEWHEAIQEAISAIAESVATLRKEPSTIYPHPPFTTPGKLKRALNVSSCLNEIVDFLSPKKRMRTAV